MVEGLDALNFALLGASFTLWLTYSFANPLLSSGNFMMLVVGIFLPSLGILIKEIKIIYLGRTKDPSFKIPETNRSPKVRFMYSLLWRFVLTVTILLFAFSLPIFWLGTGVITLSFYLTYSTIYEHYYLHFRSVNQQTFPY